MATGTAMSGDGLDVSSAEIEAALATILDRADVSLGARSRAFLQFVVAETIAGRSHRLKAFTIAVAVFDRDASFDPQTNSIVRVEATRLRRWLERYYADQGAADVLEIRIPRGAYVPQFVRRVRPVQAMPVPAPAVEASERVRPRSLWARPSLAALVAATAVVCAAGGWWAGRHGGIRPSHDDFPVGTIQSDARLRKRAPARPIVGVIIEADNDSDRRVATMLNRAVEDALSRFDTIDVRESLLADNAAGVDYVLRATVMRAGGATLSVVARLSRGASKSIVWFKDIDDVPADPAPAAVNDLAASLVRPLALSSGVVFADMRARAGARPLDCFIDHFDPQSAQTPERQGAARRCLDIVLTADPAFVPAVLLKADLDLLASVDQADAASGRMALIEAAKAVAQASRLRPESAAVEARLFDVALRTSTYEEAIGIGRRALQRNPLDADFMARLGSVYMRRGETGQGMPLLDKAAALGVTLPTSASVAIAFGAYLQGSFDRAAAALVGHDVHGSPFGLLVTALVAHARGDHGLARQAAAEFRRSFPTYAAHLSDVLDRLAFAPAVRDRVVASLKDAESEGPAGIPQAR